MHMPTTKRVKHQWNQNAPSGPGCFLKSSENALSNDPGNILISPQKRTNETVAPVRIKDSTANLIQLTFSPGAFQDKPLININAFHDRCEFWYATESAQMRCPWKSV